MPLGEAQWNELARELRRAWARVAPEWSDASDHDPGLTVLELLAYALTDLSLRSTVLDARGRRIAGRVAGCAAALAAPGNVAQTEAPCAAPPGSRAAGAAPAAVDADAAELATPRPLERVLAAALEQQAAGNVILRAILESPTDARPALETLLTQALRLCDADLALVAVQEGGRLVPAAWAGCPPEEAAALLRASDAASAVPEGTGECARGAGAPKPRPAAPGRVSPAEPVPDGPRTALAVPIRHADRAFGLVALGRHEARPFLESQRHRLEALAAHAALAIEHVRRIEELRCSGRAA
jgi:hypothetical protein